MILLREPALAVEMHASVQGNPADAWTSTSAVLDCGIDHWMMLTMSRGEETIWKEGSALSVTHPATKPPEKRNDHSNTVA